MPRRTRKNFPSRIKARRQVALVLLKEQLKTATDEEQKRIADQINTLEKRLQVY